MFLFKDYKFLSKYLEIMDRTMWRDLDFPGVESFKIIPNVKKRNFIGFLFKNVVAKISFIEDGKEVEKYIAIFNYGDNCYYAMMADELNNPDETCFVWKNWQFYLPTCFLHSDNLFTGFEVMEVIDDEEVADFLGYFKLMVEGSPVLLVKPNLLSDANNILNKYIGKRGFINQERILKNIAYSKWLDHLGNELYFPDEKYFIDTEDDEILGNNSIYHERFSYAPFKVYAVLMGKDFKENSYERDFGDFIVKLDEKNLTITFKEKRKLYFIKLWENFITFEKQEIKLPKTEKFLISILEEYYN